MSHREPRAGGQADHLTSGEGQALARERRTMERQQRAPVAGRFALAAIFAACGSRRALRATTAPSAPAAILAAPLRPGTAGVRRLRCAPRRAEEDWRAFRAQLVERSRRPGWLEAPKSEEVEASAASRGPGREGGEPRAQGSGWVHATPLIEQGSVLLSRAGSHFSLQQPYFHKAVILIVEHSEEDGDAGVILNRPMSAMSDVDGVRWPMWFGGPCSGLDLPEKEQSLWCLHANAKLAELTEPVVRGVFIASFEDARAAVADGLAKPDDFMLVSGYCGWSPGQLQEELDSGRSWTMAAVDAGVLLGRLGRRQRALRHAVRAGGGGCSGAGLAMWRRLYRLLGARPSPLGESSGDAHGDGVLGLWCRERLGMGAEEPFRWGARLLQQRARAEAARGGARLSLPPAGAVLVASASAFVLGVPDLGDRLSGLSLQFLHKGVLGLLSAPEHEGGAAVAVLLNGPALQSSGPLSDVLFGGDDQEDVVTSAFGHSFLGNVIFPPGMLADLLHTGALSAARGAAGAVGSGDGKDAAGRWVLQQPQEERWAAAGGHVGAGEEGEATLGDAQRRLWFQGFHEEFEAWDLEDLDFEDADLG